MKNLQRIALTGTLAALTSLAMIGVPSLSGAAASGAAASGAAATGAAAGTFSAKTSGAALTITAAGTTLTGGTSSAQDDSTGAAQAQGAGLITPAVASSETASVTQPGTTQNQPKTCGAPPAGDSLPSPLDQAVSLGAGCGSASATDSASGQPSASATGQLAGLSLSAGSNLLPTPVTQGSTLASTLQSVLGALPTLPAAGTPLTTLLGTLGAVVTNGTTGLLTAQFGTSTSAVTTSASTESASTQDSGATFGVVPGLGPNGGPLLSVSVGSSSANTSLDLGTAAGTATFDPAVVSVTFGTVATGSQSYSLAPGQSQTFLSGTPLESSIAVGSGTSSQSAGQASASSNGVTLDLLQGVDGGLVINLASSTAAITGKAPTTSPAVATVTPVAAPAAPAATVPGVTSVHTGEPWNGPLPLGVVGFGVLVGLALLARRRLASLLLFHHHRSRRLLLGPAASGPPPGPASGTSSVPPPVSGPARWQSHR